MSSYFELVLDTHPPIVQLAPARINQHGVLAVPYTLDEPQITFAVVQGIGPADVEPDALRVQHPAPQVADDGVVVIRTRDDVGNQGFYRLEYQLSRPGPIVGALSGAIEKMLGGRLGERIAGRVERGLSGRARGGEE